MRRLGVIGLALLMIILVSCTNEETIDPPRFDDRDLRFNLLQSDNSLGLQSYVIEVQNAGKLKIGYLKLYVSYPIKQESGSRSNPFRVEGKTRSNNPVMLGEGDKAIFQVDAPINDVFGDSALLDFDHPNLNFEGYVLEGDQIIPFGLGGGLELIIRDY
ncbi:hypothetical protein [Cohnella panacarvi]|uniref:hypothetical protein n=1 Tax=Cohnella panacarvi TaxID=400776 RepID=UPI00047EF07D|nr:hypothetical protein [Cohnella panacarvi]